MAYSLEAPAASLKGAPNDAASNKLIDEIRREMQSLSQSRHKESYIDRGIDLFYDPASRDLKQLTLVEKELEADAARGDIGSINARENEVRAELAKDDKDLHKKEVVDGVTTLS